MKLTGKAEEEFLNWLKKRVKLIDHKTHHVVALWSYTDAIDKILRYYYNQHKVDLRRSRINSLRDYNQIIKNFKHVK